MHIALDLDDVILDFCGGLVRVVNTEYDAGLTIEDINQWDLSKILNPIIGESWWKWMRRRNWLWSTFDAVPGAIGGIEKLRLQGHYLEIITTKPAWAEANTWRWLGKWRPPVQRVTIVDPDHISDKSKASPATLLVDDKPENVEEFANAGRKALLFDRPHNRVTEVTLLDGVTRVYDWRGVLDYIDFIDSMKEVERN